MSVMRWDIINELLDRSSGKRYLEIGVDEGHCGSLVRSTEKWGVDVEDHGAWVFENFYHGNSDDFFFSEKSKGLVFDVIFVDGLHHADQVYRDVINAMGHLAEGGTIVLHDCNPLTELAQRVPRQTKRWNGDCWKAVVKLRFLQPDWNVVVVDTDEGIGIVTKGPQDRPYSDKLSSLNLSELGWEDLQCARKSLLGLISVFEWRSQGEKANSFAKDNDIIVVTTLFGLPGRDELREPTQSFSGHKFICFSDRALSSEHWEVREFHSDLPPRLASRRIKSMIHKYVDCSDGQVVVFVDASMRVSSDMSELYYAVSSDAAPMAAFEHPERDCIFDESTFCQQNYRGSSSVALRGQSLRYKEAGHPENWGLFALGVFVRRMTPEVIAFGEAWWEELVNGTVREQLSFPFLLRKTGLNCVRLSQSVYDNRFTEWIGHNKDVGIV